MSEKSREGVSVRDGDKSVQVIREVEPGPILPPSAELEQYEHILPGAAERLLSMGEKQQEEKIKQTRQNNTRNHFLAVSGQWIVAFLCLCCIAVAAAGIFRGYPNAVYLGGSAAIGIFALSLISRKK